MKARTDCTVCRKRIYKEAETAYLKQEYKFFEDAAYSMAVFATIVALSVLHRRERSRTFIRSFYDEMCLIFDAPPVMGKEIRMTDMQKVLEEKYGIDFDRIKLHLESEKEFINGIQKGAKK
jgi:hypothetical protein